MTRIQDAAQALHQDWQTKAPFENIAQGFGVTSAEQAYDVQGALQKLHVPSRGAIVGRKIALASKVMQQMIGFDQPISGAIFASDVMQSPANVSADAFGRLGVECELAVELNADVAPQPTAFTAASVDGLIATVRPAFELIEDRKADYATLDPLTLIADNAWCGGVVLGPELGGVEQLGSGRHRVCFDPQRAGRRSRKHWRGRSAGIVGLGAEPFRCTGRDAAKGGDDHHWLRRAHAVSGTR